MSEYYEVDVNGDGRVDAVEVTTYEDGTAVALADVNGDGYADHAYEISETGEVVGVYDISAPEPPQPNVNEMSDVELDARLNMARVWADLPPI